MSYPNDPSTPPSKHLEELKANYKKTIHEKIALLQALSDKVLLEKNKTSLQELTDILHKFGGSAGSYGYHRVSELCKALDKDVLEHLSAEYRIDSNWISSIKHKIDEIIEAFNDQHTSSATSIALLHHDKNKPFVFIVDQDINFLKSIENAVSQYPFEIVTESNLKNAIEALNSNDFNPKAVVISEPAYADDLNEMFKLIDSAQRKSQAYPIYTALILGQDNIDIRLQAIDKGIHYILRKPINIEFLLKNIAASINAPSISNLRLLVLDDDIDFCNFVTLALAEIGITVKSIHDSSHLFHALDEFNPQFLLLDFILPKYNGMDLLKAIRRDATYNDINVLIVSSSAEALSRLNAYMVKADDILFKPLSIQYLQQRVLAIAERRSLMGNLSAKEEISSQLPRKILLDTIAQNMGKQDYPGRYLVILEIDRFADLMKEKGSDYTNELLEIINKTFEEIKNHSMEWFSFNISQYAMIFEKMDFHAVESKMKAFVQKIGENDQAHGISFNSSAVLISNDFGSPEQLLEKAENSLAEAREGHQIPFKMIVLTPQELNHSKKEVILIDTDEVLLKILKNAFESHDLSVKTFNEGKPALEVLLGTKPNNMPALIVIERKLPDMDGVDIIRTLNISHKTQSPIYFLTQFSSDKDISEGLKLGAVEYTGKPFNLAIFMQKALKVIFKT